MNKDSRGYIFANLSNVRSEMFTYYAPSSQLNSKKIHWRILCKPEDKIVRGREIIGNDVYAITYKDAKNYKLVHTSLINPDWSNAEIVAPEKSNQTLEAITHCKDYLLLTYSDGINNHIYKYHFKTKKTTEVNLPYPGSAGIFCLDNTTNNCFIGITSWDKPYTEFSLNAETGSINPSIFNKSPSYPDKYKNL